MTKQISIQMTTNRMIGAAVVAYLAIGLLTYGAESNRYEAAELAELADHPYSTMAGAYSTMAGADGFMGGLGAGLTWPIHWTLRLSYLAFKPTIPVASVQPALDMSACVSTSNGSATYCKVK